MKRSTTEYKNVYKIFYPVPLNTGTKKSSENRMRYKAHGIINGKRTFRTFHTIKEAALFVDECLIKRGKEPVNILKKKLLNE